MRVGYRRGIQVVLVSRIAAFSECGLLRAVNKNDMISAQGEALEERAIASNARQSADFKMYLMHL